MVHDKVRAVRRKVKKARAKRAKRKIQKQQAADEAAESEDDGGDGRMSAVRSEAAATKRELRGLSKDLGVPRAARAAQSVAGRAGAAIDGANVPDDAGDGLGDVGAGEFDVGVDDGEMDIAGEDEDLDIDLEGL